MDSNWLELSLRTFLSRGCSLCRSLITFLYLTQRNSYLKPFGMGRDMLSFRGDIVSSDFKAHNCMLSAFSSVHLSVCVQQQLLFCSGSAHTCTWNGTCVQSPCSIPQWEQCSTRSKSKGCRATEVWCFVRILAQGWLLAFHWKGWQREVQASFLSSFPFFLTSFFPRKACKKWI